jgi:hypothetical protein
MKYRSSLQRNIIIENSLKTILGRVPKLMRKPI